MTVLAFDTCFASLSVSVLRSDDAGDDAAASMIEARQTGHAERLVPAIREVLAQAGTDLRQIRRIAVTLGPGSFTGVRVGVACARALSLTLSVPVVGTTSLHVAAMTAAATAPEAASADLLIVAMDARKDAVYVQRFRSHGTQPDGHADLMPLDRLIASATGCNALIVGSAAPLVARAGAGLRTMLGELVPDARHLATIAATLPVLDPVAPMYLRAADARLPGGGLPSGGP